jgi:hypothetical protein
MIDPTVGKERLSVRSNYKDWLDCVFGANNLHSTPLRVSFMIVRGGTRGQGQQVGKHEQMGEQHISTRRDVKPPGALDIASIDLICGETRLKKKENRCQ